MISIPVHIAVEDELSEVVLRRILMHIDRGYSIGTAYRRGGYGYLKKTIQGWNQAAASRPFIVLTDLDRVTCPPTLIGSWLNAPSHPNLVLRVAVREVESWLLADSDGLASYLRVKASRLPEQPDELDDPKAVLVALAEMSRSKDIRSRIVPKARSTAKQGPDYNACLSAFVTETWDIDCAAEKSPSLMRSISRFREFVPTWG